MQCNTISEIPLHNMSYNSRHINAIADTGSSGHYLSPFTPCKNKARTTDGPTVTLPDGKQISPSHEAKLNIDHQYLNQNALQAYVFPDIKTPLLSIGKFCDDDKIAIFTKEKCLILNDITKLKRIEQLINLNTILEGKRNHTTKLWNINLESAHQSNSVYHCTKLGDTIEYHHRSLFSPVQSTWIQAIKNGNFTSWPNLTTDNVTKYLRPSIASAKGHIKQIKQNIRSTKKQPDNLTNLVFAKSYELTKLICSDQTGRFPITSSKGNKYLMIILDYDSNAIISQPLPSRSQQHLLQAFSKIHEKLKNAGRNPTFVRLDNEAPKVLTQYMKKEKMQFQLVPPHNHRRNYAEKAIGTWKDHFIAGITSLEKSFPLHLWCRLTQQADLTLNLLRNSRINPHLSAQADLFGPHDYNKNPLLPIGIKIIIHEKPTQRGSWSPRGIEGYYLGTSSPHYRCHRVYCTATGSERITDTIKIIPHYGNAPHLTAQDAAILTTESLTKTLEKCTTTKNFGNQQIEALQQLAKALKQTASSPHLPLPLIPQMPPAVIQTQSVQQTRVNTQDRPQTRVRRIQNIPTPRIVPDQLQLPPPSSQSTRNRTHHNLRPRPRRSHLTTSQEFLCNAIYDDATGKKLSYRQLKQRNPDIWNPSMANEIGRLAQGYKNIKGTNTITFIPKSSIPNTSKITYGRIVPDYRPLKDEPYRTRLTVGGDKLTYYDATKTDTASLPTIKTHLNSTISTPNAKYATADIKNFYLANNKLKHPEFMRMLLTDLPAEIIEQYKLEKIADDRGYVYMRIDKGMYGLKQAGRIAYENLVKHLKKYDYHPCRITKGLWTHKHNSISFVLVVDDFGIKYTKEADLQHFLQALQARYTISIDKTAKNFVGMTLDWNYENKTIDISMPEYISSLLKNIKHSKHTIEHAPHKYNVPSYGAKTQLAPDPDTSQRLPIQDKQRIQKIIGSLLYYGRAVDPTILVALSTIASQQNTPTTNTAQAVTKLLNYVATHNNATIRYKASSMILCTHSDASYLSEPKARSRAAGHFFLSSERTMQNNGPIHTVCSIIKNVMSSAPEAEIAAAFLTAKDAIPIRIALEEMGHPQPATPLHTDNSTAHGFLNETIKQKRTKAIDMRFWWLVDRVRQNQFTVHWSPGPTNLADYFSKHHSPAHHAKMRKTFLFTDKETSPTYSEVLRGCHNTRSHVPQSTQL